MNDALFRPSSFLRRRRCPGSLALESTLPEPVVEDPNRYAEEGASIHRLFANPDFPRDNLTPEQLDALELAESMESAAIAEIEARHGAKPEGFGFTELREDTLEFVLPHDHPAAPKTPEPRAWTLFSGTPDHVRMYQPSRLAIISDLKMGRNRVQPVHLNLQLRGYIVALNQEFMGLEHFYGIILQPRLSKVPTIVRYSAQDVARSAAEVVTMWEACHQEKAPRNASSEACAYCQGKAICPEFQGWAFEIQKIKHLPTATWSPEQWDLFLSRRRELSKFLDECYEEAKRIKKADPDRIPGWELKDGNDVRVVKDAVAAWMKLQSRLSPKQFSECCKVVVGEIERTLWEAHRDNPALGKLTQKEAKELVNELLGDAIEKRQNAPSLVKVKEE